MDDFPRFMQHAVIAKIPLRAGEECFIPRGGLQGGEVLAGAGSGALGLVFGRTRLSSIQA
jgi:hypothetical protein